MRCIMEVVVFLMQDKTYCLFKELNKVKNGFQLLGIGPLPTGK